MVFTLFLIATSSLCGLSQLASEMKNSVRTWGGIGHLAGPGFSPLIFLIVFLVAPESAYNGLSGSRAIASIPVQSPREISLESISKFWSRCAIIAVKILWVLHKNSDSNYDG